MHGAGDFACGSTGGVFAGDRALCAVLRDSVAAVACTDLAGCF